jgi:hypothetical protein
VCLPDSYFSNELDWQNLLSTIMNHELTIQTFHIENKMQKYWGIIQELSANNINWYEKPIDIINPAKAWALFSFDQQIGEQLLNELISLYKNNKMFFNFTGNIKTINISDFYDPTKKLENSHV